jgi:hypothetical protein
MVGSRRRFLYIVRRLTLWTILEKSVARAVSRKATKGGIVTQVSCRANQVYGSCGVEGMVA